MNIRMDIESILAVLDVLKQARHLEQIRVQALEELLDELPRELSHWKHKMMSCARKDLLRLHTYITTCDKAVEMMLREEEDKDSH